MSRLEESPSNILVMLPNWLGDVAMATPALRALRNHFPEAVITVAGKKSSCLLVEGLSSIDGAYIFPAKVDLIRMLSHARNMAPYARDICVVLPHSFRAALVARMTRAKQRIGYARGGRSMLFTDTVTPYRENGKITPVYMAEEYLHLVSLLGCVDDNQGLELNAAAIEVDAVRACIDVTRPVVGFAPGAAFGPAKCWPAARYARVADELTQRYDVQCLLFTGPGEEETREAVMREASIARFIPFHHGKPTIARLKAAISQVDLFIGNDSGPRHIAIAFKKPVVCIMGPTSPRYTDSPWEIGQVLRVDVDCGPCQKPVCATDHRCMTRITPEMVVDAASSYLQALKTHVQQ